MTDKHAILHGNKPATLDDVEELLRLHEEVERKMLEDMFKRLVPNGDIEGHCDYHAKVMKAVEAQEEFWKAAKIELMKKGVGALWEVGKIVLILAAIGLLAKLGIALPAFFVGGDK